jgi:bifunctional DNA-binding transcriptional regulator/antitoxin component of YhaV-PrlF toxin-antitoxin module
MSQRHTFTAVIQAGSGGGAFAEVPFDVEEVFGDKRPQVKATMEGESFVWRLIRMGGPHHIVGVPKGVRDKAGKNIGDTIEITVEADNTPREVVVPADLEAALGSDAEAKEFFDALSYTHRKEYVRWIETAKRDDTRARRVVKTMKMLKEKQRGV